MLAWIDPNRFFVLIIIFDSILDYSCLSFMVWLCTQGSGHSTAYQPRGDAPQTYEEIRDACVDQGVLWEDPDFPAEDSSIYFKDPPSVWPDIQWMRPSVSSTQILGALYTINVWHSGLDKPQMLTELQVMIQSNPSTKTNLEVTPKGDIFRRVHLIRKVVMQAERTGL